jgi:HK97 gp10 family phage protein
MANKLAKISGTKVTIDAMEALPRATRTKMIRPAMRAGAKIIQTQVQQNLATDLASSIRKTGLLQRSVVVRSLKMKRKAMRIAVTLAPKKINKHGVRVGLYGAVRELGKEGQMPRPNFRPAVQQTNSQVQATVEGIARKNLDAAVAEAKRPGAQK